jgi:hypothetical protein
MLHHAKATIVPGEELRRVAEPIIGLDPAGDEVAVGTVLGGKSLIVMNKTGQYLMRRSSQPLAWLASSETSLRNSYVSLVCPNCWASSLYGEEKHMHLFFT